MEHPFQLQRYLSRYWIESNNIKNEFGKPIEFADHRFMLDLYDDKSMSTAIIKASQVGASTMMNIKLLHRARFLGINQIYTLPTDGDVSDFVRSKTNRIIMVNDCLTRDLGKRSVDSIEQKQVGKAFIFFRGTFGKQKAIMLTSDWNYHDELDTSDPMVIETYESRMGASKLGGMEYFSTPSIPNFGIDLKWQQSDQKFWRITCPHCGHIYHQEWEERDGYPGTVDLERRCYFCPKCKQEVTTQQISDHGNWEAKYPGREISGYWIPQMICPWISAKRLIKKFEDSEDISQFYNFVLGLPYISADQRIPEQLFVKNLVEGVRADLASGNVAGIDTGGEKGLHVTVGNAKGIFWMQVLKDHITTGDGRFHCEYCGRSKPQGDCGCRFEQLAECLSFYDVRVAVIDGMPYTEEDYALARKFPYKVFLNWFNDDPKLLEIVRYLDEEGKGMEFEEEVKVLTARTRIIDHAVSELRRGSIRFDMPRDSVHFQMLCKHASTMYARDVPLANLLGIRREWANTGANDMFLSFIYWLVAYMKGAKSEPNK